MTMLVIPAGVDWELLVVNNNCTDDTEEVIAQHAGYLPIRRLFEPKQGLSNARNCAVAAATGDLILFTDDDVLVDDEWIVEYSEAFSRWPSAAIFGGPIQPWFAGTPPRWLKEVFPHSSRGVNPYVDLWVGGVYGLRDFGDKPIPLTHDVIPFGGNFAVRAKDHARYFYDTNLGRRPNSNVGDEETTLIRKMLAEGAEGWWVPRVRVRHYVPEQLQTIRYLRGYLSGQGELHGRKMSNDGFPKWFGRPRWLWRQAIETEVKYRIRRILCKPEVWIEDLIKSSYIRGQIAGYASPGGISGSQSEP